MSCSHRTRSPNMAVFSKTLDIAENRAVSHYSSNLSCEPRHEKPALSICENKGADQLTVHSLCLHHCLDKLGLFLMHVLYQASYCPRGARWPGG